MTKTNFARLTFRTNLNEMGAGKELCYGLSSVVQIGSSLWVTKDETISLERFTQKGQDSSGNNHYGNHEQFFIVDYLHLPTSSESGSDIADADIEGLAYEDGFLWLVGSHSLKRRKPKGKTAVEKDSEHLATVDSDGNRYLIARILVMEKDGVYTLVKEVEPYGKRHAALLHGDDHGNKITRALGEDKHLCAFLDIPGRHSGI